MEFYVDSHSGAELNEIIEFRKRIYLDKYTNSLNLKLLDWNYADSNSLHLMVRDSSTKKILSYLRMSLFRQKAALETALRMQMDFNFSTTATLLSRACTSSSYSNKGLHSLLRFHGIKAALELHSTIVVGTLETNSHRLQPVIELGYTVLKTANEWENSIIKNTSPVALIGLMSTELMTLAASKLAGKYQPQLIKYNLNGVSAI